MGSIWIAEHLGLQTQVAVKFIDEASGKSFAWKFDTIVAVFDLNRVVPAGMLEGHQVKAYVATSYRRMHNS